MKNIYNKIIEKSPTFRRRLAFSATAIIGLFVFFVWIFQTTENMKKSFEISESKRQEINRSIPSLKEELKETENAKNDLLNQKQMIEDLYNNTNENLTSPQTEEKTTPDKESPENIQKEAPVDSQKSPTETNQIEGLIMEKSSN